MAEQEPVEEEDIVDFHAVEHNKKSHKEIPKPESASDTISCSKNGRTYKHQNRDTFYQPSDDMCAAKPLFFIGNRS